MEIMRGQWDRGQIYGVFAPGPGMHKVQRLAVLGAGVLWLLLFWWSDWTWWPQLLLLIIPTVLVVLPGIRKLVDESWGLIAGLLLAAYTLMFSVDGALVAVAWGAAIGAVAAASFRRHRFGWRKWAPLAALVPAIVLLVLGGLAWWATASDRAEREAQQRAEQHAYDKSKLLPTARGSVFMLVEAIGLDYPERRARACAVFTPEAASQFAAAHQAPDCPAALLQLHGKVRKFHDYVNQMSIPSDAVFQDYKAKTARIDACRLEFTSILAGGDPQAGPQVGVLHLQQQYSNGFLITGYEACAPRGR
uniref:hypothetical protein n=1 Tax=Amycolatopsis sp. CA-290885 TaxID=3239925 RepID=UPI003F4937A4